MAYLLPTTYIIYCSKREKKTHPERGSIFSGAVREIGRKKTFKLMEWHEKVEASFNKSYLKV